MATGSEHNRRKYLTEQDIDRQFQELIRLRLRPDWRWCDVCTAFLGDKRDEPGWPEVSPDICEQCKQDNMQRR